MELPIKMCTLNKHPHPDLEEIPKNPPAAEK
jgi:hypothetical protein